MDAVDAALIALSNLGFAFWLHALHQRHERQKQAHQRAKQWTEPDQPWPRDPSLVEIDQHGVYVHTDAVQARAELWAEIRKLREDAQQVRTLPAEEDERGALQWPAPCMPEDFP